MYPFRFIAKCQKKSIKDQYKLGARMFDLRIGFDGITPIFKHGIIAYKGDVEETLGTINSFEELIKVRLVLEVNKNTKHLGIIENLFRFYCERWQQSYKNIEFFAGRRKFDWLQLYDFNTEEPIIVQKISSMNKSKIDNIWPWLYAKLNNKKSIASHNKNTWLFLDFIEIQ